MLGSKRVYSTGVKIKCLCQETFSVSGPLDPKQRTELTYTQRGQPLYRGTFFGYVCPCCGIDHEKDWYAHNEAGRGAYYMDVNNNNSRVEEQLQS